ncbi:O-acetyl-ADP-ribose deacetylase 1 [Nibea albiflora]|uniref:O-acetyl-ADP-ribose deacetylase 1 n=1 Tax=Nibea albiflora TaxID=240163 RepID=A0ACB7EKE5_NIBAL|nr:O-acetyl-ADP-ribose deacetylase 1 [Nibea albiflora]
MLPPLGQPADGTWRPNYVTGNLFSCPEDEALAHCISEDCRMGAGIAVMFRNKFKGQLELKEQKKLTGQCAVLKRGRRFVYYLITKKKASQKPTYDSLQRSLEDMKSHCVLNGVTRISMPRVHVTVQMKEYERGTEYSQLQERGEKRARKGQKQRGDDEEGKARQMTYKHGRERGREMEREIERLSEAEQEWKRVGVHSRAMSTAVHCSAQPPLCSLLTIRFHALKRPLQQQSCTAQRAAAC